jgi:acyl dehydratase
MAQTQVFFEDVEVDYKIPKLVKAPITETQLVMYAGASGDFNPIHTVHSFGVKAGFGGVIGHGMLSMAFVGQFMTDWVGINALKNLFVQFRSVTKPQDIITVEGTVTEKYSKDGENYINCDIVATNQKGDVIVTGKATAALPSKNK